MKTINILCGALIVLAALMAPPALAASLLSASAGVILMASGVIAAPPAQAIVQPVPVVQVVRIPDPVRMFELDSGRGVVVFRNIDGKLTSRFYRA